jgi:hypothetical protein
VKPPLGGLKQVRRKRWRTPPGLSAQGPCHRCHRCHRFFVMVGGGCSPPDTNSEGVCSAVFRARCAGFSVTGAFLCGKPVTPVTECASDPSFTRKEGFSGSAPVTALAPGPVTKPVTKWVSGSSGAGFFVASAVNEFVDLPSGSSLTYVCDDVTTVTTSPGPPYGKVSILKTTHGVCFPAGGRGWEYRHSRHIVTLPSLSCPFGASSAAFSSFEVEAR